MSSLLPRKVLFGNPERTSVTLSRDGTRIAYLAPFNGVLNVWVAPADAPLEARPVTHDTERGIRAYFWSYNPGFILYIQDTAGDEDWHLFAVDIESTEARDLTPFKGVTVQIEAISENFPDEALISINNRDPRLHDVHRVNILTGEMEQVVLNDVGATRLLADDQFNVRLAIVVPPEGGGSILSRSESGDWEEAIRYGTEDDLTTFPLGFDAEGATLYMMDSRGRDTSAAVAIDMASMAESELASDPRSDASGFLIHPGSRKLQAVAFEYERRSWQVLDESIAADLERVDDPSQGQFEVVSRTLDDSKWIVAYEKDDGPVRFYLYSREFGRLEFLFSDRPELDGANLSRMRSAIVKSRDGLDLVVYFTLPVDSDVTGSGTPNEALPTVLQVHGGPWGRDTWGYDPHHQLLASRGYAVVSVNFRGSTGLGKAFTNAGNLEWAGKMHDDLIDVVKWAVESGIADRDRVAIWGGSYGGYATLVGLTFTPDVFACGVDIVGPSNLNTLLESVPPYWEPMIAMFRTRVGDNTTEDGRRFLNSRSPLSRVDSIVRPLLIGQGANDPRVKRAESDQIVNAMTERGIPVTYLLFPDEGHGFARPENYLSFAAVAEAFLSRCLGGRFEPIGGDFEGSSIEVLVGAAEVPGLRDALGST